MVRDGGYFPVLARLEDDTVVAVLRMGAGHVGLAGRLAVVRSEDAGTTWSEPLTIANSDADDRNPALGVTRDGVIACAYHIQRNYNEAGKYGDFGQRADVMLTRSHDGGRTWEAPYRMDFEPLQGRSPYGKILALPDGTLLLPLYGDEIGAEGQGEPNCSYIARSTDGGLTWCDPTLIARGFNETALAPLTGGTLLAALRTNIPEVADHVWLSRSEDQGRTWSEPRQITQPSEHPADLLALADGSVLMTYGRRHEPCGVRALILRGDNQSEELLLADDAVSGDCGYPSSVQLSDGRIVSAYYAAGTADWQIYNPEGCVARAVVWTL
jgi:hypothetical protein